MGGDLRDRQGALPAAQAHHPALLGGQALERDVLRDQQGHQVHRAARAGDAARHDVRPDQARIAPLTAHGRRVPLVSSLPRREARSFIRWTIRPASAVGSAHTPSIAFWPAAVIRTSAWSYSIRFCLSRLSLSPHSTARALPSDCTPLTAAANASASSRLIDSECASRSPSPELRTE